MASNSLEESFRFPLFLPPNLFSTLALSHAACPALTPGLVLILRYCRRSRKSAGFLTLSSRDPQINRSLTRLAVSSIMLPMSLKSTAKRIARGFGLEVSRAKLETQAPSDGEYAAIHPHATYSPWNKDREFQDVYSSVAKSTYVDKYRCFELWKLVEQSEKLGRGSLIEVGVWRGGTGALIATQAKKCRIQEKVYLCDTFSGVVKAGPRDSAYKGGEHSDTSRQIVEELIEKMHLDNVEVLHGIFPDQTGHHIEHLQFRFCHIDVDVYQSAKDIVDWIWDKMVVGGIVVYDDYGFDGCDGITKYVEEQTGCPDRIVLHNLNGHAVVIKVPPKR